MTLREFQKKKKNEVCMRVATACENRVKGGEDGVINSFLGCKHNPAQQKHATPLADKTID